MTLALVLSLSLNVLTIVITLFQLKNGEKKDRLIVRERQQYAATIKELLDRLMHVTGNTWTVPPRELPKEAEEFLDEETKLALEGWREA